MNQTMADRLAREIFEHHGVNPNQVASIDRVIRMLDEERDMRMRTENALVEAGENLDNRNEQIDGLNRRIGNLNEDQREILRQLQEERQRSREFSDFREAVFILANAQRVPLTDFDPALPIIQIREIRQKFGVTLLVAKAIHDDWKRREADEAFAQNLRDREDEGTFEEVEEITEEEFIHPDDPSIQDTRSEEAEALDREVGL